jgi:hypothetical protein
MRNIWGPHKPHGLLAAGPVAGHRWPDQLSDENISARLYHCVRSGGELSCLSCLQILKECTPNCKKLLELQWGTYIYLQWICPECLGNLKLVKFTTGAITTCLGNLKLVKFKSGVLGTMLYNPKMADMFTFHEVRFKSREVYIAIWLKQN